MSYLGSFLFEGRKVAHLIISSDEGEILKKSIGEAVIPKDEKHYQELLKSHEWVLLPLKEFKSYDHVLSPQEFAAVKVVDLVQLDLLSRQAIMRFKDTPYQLSRRLTGKMANERMFQKIKVTLVDHWSQPVETETLVRAAKFLAEHKPLALSEEQRKKLVAERSGGSLTLAENPKKTRRLAKS